MTDARRTATVTVLFCDLVDSTARQTRLGDDAADDFRRRFFAALADAARLTHGEVVKTMGDGMMVVFRDSTADAVECASRMHDAVHALADDASLRVGISAGEAALEDGDWFGIPVVEAARLCAAANADQTLVSELVRSLVGSRGGHQFRSLGALTLKGLAAPLPAAAVVRDVQDASETWDMARPPESQRRRRSTRWWVPATAVILLVAVAGGFAIFRSSDKAEAPRLTAVAYTPALERAKCPDEFRRQVPNGRCNTLVVPEDRTQPDGRRLRLLVTRAPALGALPAKDPTIALTRSGAALATSPARDHSEVITIGTRLSFEPSSAMACAEFEPVGRRLLSRPANDVSVIRDGQAALRHCRDALTKSGVALDHYTYEDAGNDVIDLIRALKVDDVNLVASQRSALIAQVVVRDASKVVRSVTLQNPWPLARATMDPTAQLASAFDQYVAMCKADDLCARAYPDLPRLLHERWLQGKENPSVVVAEHPITRERLPVRLDGEATARAVAATIGDPTTSALLAAGIARPPAELVAGVVLSLRTIFYERDFPWASFLSGWCSQRLHVLNPSHTLSSQTRPELAGLDDGVFQWLCEAWDVPEAPATMFEPVVATVPALIVTTPLEAQTPIDAATRVASGLANATVFTIPTFGVDVLDSGRVPCLNDLRRTFLADPTRRLDVSQCAKKIPPIKFVTNPATP